MARLSDIARKFKRDMRGQFAVQFAILALPLLAAVTFAIDYMGAGREKVEVKTALDAAVIAAVNNNTLTNAEKEAYALAHFNKNYTGKIKFKLNPVATEDRVEMSAYGQSPVTISEIVGVKGIDISEKSAAELTSENVICALALAPSGDARISFAGKSKFLAPTCSIHANSKDPQAIWQSGGTPPIAKNFCSSGGAKGKFQPYAKGDCAPVEDPYKYHKAPAPLPCINLGDISDIRLSTEQNIENLTGSNITLAPGSYCGGVTVDGINVRFLPGTHTIVDGPLIFRNNAVAAGDGVTFVMSGLDSTLNIQTGAQVNIKAPNSGPLAGLVFFQDVGTQTGTGGIFPNGINILSSGGSLDVTGTVYFPTQTVEVQGNSAFGSNAPATSFIAYNIDFYGSPTIHISVDHHRAGLPPIMPRTEDGARLVE